MSVPGKLSILLLFVGLSLLAALSYAQTLAFPGAEGFGKYTTGGRGGKIIIVKNLNDDGPGSLRDAIEKEGPRTIVFAVSGIIELQSILNINNGDVTIAGQSAPGEGITLKNYTLRVNADNVIIRYIRSRMGDEKKQQDDAFSVIRQKDIIIDHCTFSWGTDEAASAYDNKNFTMQWCIISESLNNSVHEKGEHGYGGIWGGKGATFHHNLLAHHKSRNPRFNGARTSGTPEQEIVDFRNNVVYNWKSNSAYAGESGNHNMVNNYYKPGPATSKTSYSRFVEPWEPYGKYYLSGNIMHDNEKVTADNYYGVHCDNRNAALVDTPIGVMPVPDQSAKEAYYQVLAAAGASFARDAIDRRIIEEVKSGTAHFGKDKKGIIDSQKDVGGWIELKSYPAPADNDGDGMSDSWESKKGLDPEDSNDHASYTLNKEFTNVETYLNELLETKINNE